VRISAPLREAQLVESRVMNLIHYQTLVASKAARAVLAAPNRLLVDFGLRRAHGAEAGLLSARASYIAGFSGTATLEAARQFGVPVYGTMAHSYVQAHADEISAFESFIRAHPENAMLLIDTYDTERAAHKVVELSAKLRADGLAIKGVRIDSGDLREHARRVRGIFDAAGLGGITIFASGNLDEYRLRDLVTQRAPSRRVRRRHTNEHIGRCAVSRLRLQAGGVRGPAAAQALRGQVHLARLQAGVPSFRR